MAASEIGPEIVLASASASATVHPAAGGRLGQLVVDGRPLLRGPEAGSLTWNEWGCYPLLPWSNRIPGGRIQFEGRSLEVPVSWTDGSALHGLAARDAWTVVESTTTTADLTIAFDVGCYQVSGRQTFSLTATHLDLELEVVNRGPDRVPAGLGIHPWFVAGPISVPADQAWPGEPMPTGPPRAVTRDEDLRTLRTPPSMDRCYTALTDHAAQVPGLRLSWSGPVTQVVVYSGTPGWVCVEPVTMANDGFRLAEEGVPGSGVVALDPGAALRVAYRFAW